MSTILSSWTGGHFRNIPVIPLLTQERLPFYRHDLANWSPHLGIQFLWLSSLPPLNFRDLNSCCLHTCSSPTQGNTLDRRLWHRSNARPSDWLQGRLPELSGSSEQAAERKSKPCLCLAPTQPKAAPPTGTHMMLALCTAVTLLRWLFRAYSKANSAIRLLAASVMSLILCTTPSTIWKRGSSVLLKGCGNHLALDRRCVQTTPSVPGLHGASCQGEHHAYGMSAGLVMFTPAREPHIISSTAQMRKTKLQRWLPMKLRIQTSNRGQVPKPVPWSTQASVWGDKTNTHNSSLSERERSLGNVFTWEFE